MASTPLSIRFDSALLERLRRSAATSDTTPSGLAQRLVDEGLRAQEFPGIAFRNGPSGRRAGLAAGPDVWEVIVALRDSEQRGDAALKVVASEFDLTAGQVGVALAYYGTNADEVDTEIAENEGAAEDALRSWESRRRLLA